MRGSKGGRREGICSSKLKVVPKDRLQVGLHLQAAFVTLQTTRSWRWRNRGADKGGDEGLEELALLLLDDLRHGLDHPGEAELGGGLVELLLGGEEGEQEVGFLQVRFLEQADEEILKGLQLGLKYVQPLATKEFRPGGSFRLSFIILPPDDHTWEAVSHPQTCHGTGREQTEGCRTRDIVSRQPIPGLHPRSWRSRRSSGLG